MKTDPNYTPKLTITPKANTKAATLIFYGVPIALLLLALPFPFFRHIFTFASFIIAPITVLGCYAAYEDKEHGVKRDRPPKGFSLPSWCKHAFFLFIIAGSAGLRLGWYIVPVIWVINWVCLVSLQSHMEATYREEKQS
jgi:hypothetical protein